MLLTILQNGDGFRPTRDPVYQCANDMQYNERHFTGIGATGVDSISEVLLLTSHHFTGEAMMKLLVTHHITGGVIAFTQFY